MEVSRVLVLVALISATMGGMAQNRLEPTVMNARHSGGYDKILMEQLDREGWIIYMQRPSFSPESSLHLKLGQGDTLVYQHNKENLWYIITGQQKNKKRKHKKASPSMPEVIRHELVISDSIAQLLFQLVDAAVETSMYAPWRSMIMDGTSHVFFSYNHQAACHSPRGGLPKQLVDVMIQCCKATEGQHPDSITMLLPQIKELKRQYRMLYLPELYVLSQHSRTTQQSGHPKVCSKSLHSACLNIHWKDSTENAHANVDSLCNAYKQTYGQEFQELSRHLFVNYDFTHTRPVEISIEDCDHPKAVLRPGRLGNWIVSYELTVPPGMSSPQSLQPLIQNLAALPEGNYVHDGTWKKQQ